MPVRFRLIVILSLLIALGSSGAVGQPRTITGITTLASMDVTDCDGIALGDIDDDGAVDILTSSGSNGDVYWFEHGTTSTDWRRHTIYTGATEIEGNALGDFDGDGQLEGISLDQKGHDILLHQPEEDTPDAWTTEKIQENRPYLQESLVTDVDDDGRPELVYTWEGTAPHSGGIHWLDLEGEALLDPEAWTDHTMVTHESAWWIPSLRLDVNQDGRASEIIYTARNLQDRNAGAQPGLFWLAPEDPETRWTRSIIDTTLAHPLHVDIGRFSRGAGSRDLIVGGFDTRHLHVYLWRNSWHHRTFDLPTIDGQTFREIWNVKAIPLGEERRDAMLVVVSRESGSALVVYEYREGQYESQVLQRMSYTHPLDDRLVLRDLTDDGHPELLVPDSGGDQLSIYQFEWTD